MMRLQTKKIHAKKNCLVSPKNKYTKKNCSMSSWMSPSECLHDLDELVVLPLLDESAEGNSTW